MREPREVRWVDNCSVFLRPDLGLRFDAATFDTWHCCAEDLCMQAKDKGIRTLVPPAVAGHAGMSTGGLEWTEDFRVYDRKLRAKWPNRGLGAR